MNTEMVLWAINYLVGGYFLIANMSYGITLLISARALRERKKNEKRMIDQMGTLKASGLAPSVTLIVPAYNEERVILATTNCFLGLDYPNLEIIIIDDCSSDLTASKLIDAFDLNPSPMIRHSRLSSADKIETYESKNFPNLKLIRQNGRGKAGALNTGIDFASGELILTADADTMPEKDSLLRMILAWQEDPERIVGVSGTVRILNGAKIKPDGTVSGKLSHSPLIMFQITEYIRSFYCGRVAWDHMESTLLLSGAFSLFKKSALIEARGFNEKSITEDFEIILRLRRTFAEQSKPIRFRLLPEPLCWTLVPHTWWEVRKQRHRWQKGLAEGLKENLSMFLNYRYGTCAFTNFPYLVVFEWLGVIFEFLGYLSVSLSLIMGIISMKVLLGLIAAGITYSSFVTIIGIHLEEYNYARHHSRKDILPFLLTSIFENIGYRQIIWWWRFEAMIRMPFEKTVWGAHIRQHLPEPEVRKKKKSDVA